MPAEVALASKIARIDAALDEAQVPHAFGGALALAYYAEPRATHDIDINVFVAPSDGERVRRTLGVAAGSDVTLDAAAVARDGQGRAWWGTTPIDLFFACHPIHDAMRHGARRVPFADGTIPILSPEHLVVCKAVFDRPQDWVDIDAVLATGTALDAGSCLTWLGRIVGEDDPRLARLADDLGHQARSPGPTPPRRKGAGPPVPD